ncbi:hypothetical protein AU195_03075 [Mycobacterium sp. IS-1496]|uniref:sacsin N-terminal ATP-binding-like domain-containing protein n=1 Tax=Mycobacterium sp. IS-1496 TaxID=1772284 RepID=UPI0007416382|nr:DUF3883 domain-containing protein [Mycobacterium sp. IS-1496]KUI21794.1 hypothetical protein AU195_03075 [Mycobacterium sp. IS-1496]
MIKPADSQTIAEQIRARTLKRIELIGQGEDVWDFHATIKSLSESTSREYAGRALLELVQNGHDALTAENPGRVHVLLDSNPQHPALYVANEGEPFTEKNFKGIVDFGLSSKVAGQGIGNKGLGFRSVLQLTDHPEVYSRDPDDPTDRRFAGYSFRYPHHEEIVALAARAGVPEQRMADASPLDLPVPASIGADFELQRFADEGFATVVKLPLRDSAAVNAARQQINAVESAEAPILLFLDRLTELRIDILDSEAAISDTTRLTRVETDATVPPNQPTVRDVDLGPQGRYLLLRGRVDLADIRAAISHSVEVKLIDPKWLEWTSTEEAWVGVALRTDEDLDAGTVYTFLPTQQTAPVCAHIQAPFFANLARRQVELDVPLNNFLMTRIASTCIEFMRILRDNAEQARVSALCADLVAWDPERSSHLIEACPEFVAESCVPVADGRTWSCFDDAYIWPADDDDSLRSVITAAVVARQGFPVVQPTIGDIRIARLAALHLDLLETRMVPSLAIIADVVEKVAGELHKKKASARRWTDFYADLTSLFDPDTASELASKKVILDQKGKLRKAMSGEGATTKAPVIFLPPEPADDGGDLAQATRVPAALARRIVYAHSDIDWAKSTAEWYSAADLLTEAGLVHCYGTDELLEIIGGFLESRPTQAVQKAALEYGFNLYSQLAPNQRNTLAAIPFTVPTREGKWRLARTAAFSAAWDTPGGILLERLLRSATDETPQLLELGTQLTAGPTEWPLPVDELTEWKKFLECIGVTDGLPLIRVAVAPRIGDSLWPSGLSQLLGLNAVTREAWTAEVRWDGGHNPYTEYGFATELSLLPGAGEIELLGHAARQTFAQLIALGLDAWPDEALNVKVYRPGRSRDEHNVYSWATPAAAYLRRAPWLPLGRRHDDDSEHDFATCAEAWLPAEGPQLPDFVPHITAALRGQLVKTPRTRARIEDLGVRVFGTERYSADMLRDLPKYLEEGRVSPLRVTQFKRQYRQAWDNQLRGEQDWPWDEDTAPVVVVIKNGLMESVALEEEESDLLVQDEADPTKQSLIGLTGQAVLLADAAKGSQIASLMRHHGVEVKLTSEIAVDVYGDEQRIIPTDDYPLLVGDDRPWIATIVAIVAEFKSGSFVRQTDQSINTILQRLRKVRVVRVESTRFIVAGSEIDPPLHTKCLPLESESDPTIVVWPPLVSTYDELEQCAPAIATLIHNPDLADHLALVFTRLGQVEPEGDSAPSDTQLAAALQISIEQVAEARAGLRGSVADLIARLRIVVSYFASDGDLEEFDTRVRHVTDAAELGTALDPIVDVLPISAQELIELCHRNTSLSELRDSLSLDFRRFNAAIVHANPTQLPLTHPDQHSRALSDYVELHRTGIVDRLREAYAPRAQLGADLSEYAAAKNLEGLLPDPDWLSEYAIPPRELIAALVVDWLGTHEASGDLTAVCKLAPVDELRRQNHNALEVLLAETEPRVRAWSRRNDRRLPSAWQAPTLGGRAALEASQLADFQILTQEILFKMIRNELGWPDGMPATLDLSQLDLSEDELLSREEFDSEERARLRYERTHITVDGREMSTNLQDLRQIAEAVAQGITETTLDYAEKLTLRVVPSNAAHGGGNRPAKAAVAAPTSRDLSDEQRVAIGLAGEAAVKLWLERRYPKVEWVSGYRNIIQGGDVGSDSYGFDFQVETQSRQKRYFEVKAFSGDISGAAEFMLGETEVRAAQQHGNRYELLLVSEARDSDRRRILRVPNPLSTAGRGKYSLIGKGLRYSCQFDYSRGGAEELSIPADGVFQATSVPVC